MARVPRCFGVLGQRRGLDYVRLAVGPVGSCPGVLSVGCRGAWAMLEGRVENKLLVIRVDVGMVDWSRGSGRKVRRDVPVGVSGLRT